MYEGLSLFYDTLTQDVNYGAIARFVSGRIRRSGAYRDYIARGERPILLDCGCGTGRLIAELRDEFECIGLDASEEMLDAARSGVPGPDVLWICQDMSRMDLYGSVTAVVSVTDSVNHLISDRKLAAFFARAHNFLDPGGLLIFDVLTEERFAGGALEYFADLDELSCFWNGRYDPKSGICTYDISCFRPVEPGSDQYVRTDDRVREKVRSGEQLTARLRDAGFVKITVLRGGRGGAPGGRTGAGRLYFVCEKGY